MVGIGYEAVLASFVKNEVVNGLVFPFFSFNRTNNFPRGAVALLSLTEAALQGFSTRQPNHHVGGAERPCISCCDGIVK